MRVRLTVTGRATVPSAPFRVGGQGKPVRIRRGPATVTGDATRASAAALEPLGRRRRPGKARGGRPGSQETCPGRNAHIALVERGGSMLHRLAGLALAATVLLVPASVASAAPVTVNLRVEGPTSTLFEGPVTTDVRPFQFTAGNDTAPHECDATAANAGSSPVPVPTRGAAITAASLAAPFTTIGTFSASLGSPSFDQIAGQSTAFDPATNSFLVEYKNGVSASVGACGDPIATGDDVLFAYGSGNERLLRLTGPAAATIDVPFTVTVRDAASGNPVAGATVAGATTDAAGNATVTLTQSGVQRLKAEASNAVRSNALVVTVPAREGGAVLPQPRPTPAAPDRTAPRARLLSPRNGATYRAARFVPRTIRVAVDESGSGVRTVKLRLTRRVGNRCFSFSGRRERFIGAKCGRGFFFTVSDRAPVSYLLPQRLGRGRYVLDVEAIDRAFNRDAVGDRGRNRSVFQVR